ncbi:MAG: hypothetical protein WD696_04810 [Bryobacteraceae bacterium]
MDLYKAIRALHEEKKRLEQVIASLEELQNAEVPADIRPRRRGRKSMDAEARREVSERMKRYWANRRKQAGT